MAHKLHHPEVMKIRNRYHLARRHADWPRIKALAASGDDEKVEQAHSLARKAVSSPARILAMQRGARVALARKVSFLRVQKEREKLIRSALAGLSDRAAVLLTRARGKDGKISPAKMHPLMAALKAENRVAYASVNRTFLGLVKTGAKSGILSAMAIAETIKSSLIASRKKAKEDDSSNGLDVQWVSKTVGPLDENDPLYKVFKDNSIDKVCTLIKLREEDDEDDDTVDPAAQTLTYAVDSGVFQKIFTGAMQQTMEAGLFGTTGVSNKVWDLRDQNYLILKRIVAAGIANGDSPSDIAASIQDLLVQPAGFDFSGAGPGVYGSAWKNAMRLARTESNRAYGAAHALFAAQKEWNVIWHVSEGQREEDECDDLDGVEMTPEEFMDQFPQHPNCMCYSTLSVPEFGDDGSDEDSE